MEYLVIIGIVFFVFILIGIGGAQQIKEKKNTIETMLSKLDNFTMNQIISSQDAKTSIAFDENRKLLCLIDFSGESMRHKIISAKEIISIEIIENGKTITKTDRGSQIGGALVGGLALGGVGAIIGGLSGKTSSETKVNKVALHIIINDVQQPTFDLDFISIEMQKDSYFYKDAIHKAEHWYGLLSVLIKNAEVNQAPQVQRVIENTTNLSDELLKIADLRQKGILSEEEYIKCKEKIISNN